MNHTEVEELVIALVKQYPQEQRVGIAFGYILAYYGWTTPEIVALIHKMELP